MRGAKKIKFKRLFLTISILIIFIFGGAFANIGTYNSVFAKGTTSHSAGGSFKSGSFSSPKSSGSTYKSGSFSNSKKSASDTNNTNTSTYSGGTKRSFLPIPIFIPWGHSYYGYGSPIVNMVQLVIFIILIIFIIRLFKKYKRRR